MCILTAQGDAPNSMSKGLAAGTQYSQLNPFKFIFKYDEKGTIPMVSTSALAT